MFKRLYDRVLGWAAHAHAPRYLAVLSFAESSFFPIPPDVMLAPMCLAQPRRAWWYAGLCTLSSVLGGAAGYLLGSLAFHWIEPWLLQSALADPFQAAVTAFERHGVWYILLAGFSPIPYKAFTIGAGVVGMPFLPFLLGSIAGRGGRFFLVAGLLRLGGDNVAARLRHWVDLAGWITVAVAVLVGLFLWWRGELL